jgi:DNA-binding transcriptional regulator YiaG
MEETTYSKEELTRILQSLKNKEFLDIVSDVVVERIENPQQLRASIEAISNETNKKAYQQKDMPLRPRFDATMLHDAISYQLENEAPPTDVYSYVQEIYQKDDDWMKKAKHTELPQSTRSAVAKEIKKQGSEAIDKVDKLGLSIPSVIRDNRTPSKAIREIDSYISLADRVEALETKVDHLDTRQTVTEIKLQCLVEETNTPLNPNKIAALYLKKQGMTQKQISKQLGVDTRTIRRWFKDLEYHLLEDN